MGTDLQPMVMSKAKPLISLSYLECKVNMIREITASHLSRRKDCHASRWAGSYGVVKEGLPEEVTFEPQPV